MNWKGCERNWLQPKIVLKCHVMEECIHIVDCLHTTLKLSTHVLISDLSQQVSDPQVQNLSEETE
jgi:hypothetical protein